ncbi:MAG: protein translocase subunit SecD [Limisphaerales bacterium]
MKNRIIWVGATLFAVAWALSALYPPKPRDLIETFIRKADRSDANFTAIVTRARELAAERAGTNAVTPALQFRALADAVGTNQLVSFFPTQPIPEGREPNAAILNAVQQASLGRIRLGLDLQGGMAFVVQMDTNRLADAGDRDRALDQALEILRKRVDRMGVAEPQIQKIGDDRVEIQMPGVTDAQKAEVKRQIERAAFLEFRMVHPESGRLLAEGLVPPGYEVLTLGDRRTDRGVRAQGERMLVRKKPERGLTGSYITRAAAVPDPVTGAPEIEFELNGEGAALFREITTEFQPRGNQEFFLAIVLDGELYSAPRINSIIPNGRGVIQGRFDYKEATELARVLMNPLEAPVKIVEESSVSATLGADSIRSGLRAALLGTVFVAAFMLVYYLVGGAVANVALLVNIIVLLGIMAGQEVTLTLPGIAGIVLTIGMAVDANVLIFERIREELAAGKSLKGAVAAGYGKAFWTIFDSNLTTLISSVIMIWLGTGPVKGFGVTLTIGICVSMFTALVVTRLILDFLIERGVVKQLRMLHLIGGTKIDFLKWAAPAFFASWLLIVIGIGYGIHRGRDVVGVDFAGGDAITLGFQQRPEMDGLRGALAGAGMADALVNFTRSPTDASERLVVTVAFGEGEKAKQALAAKFPDAGFQVLGEQRKGPSVGAQIQLSAVKSILLALFGILLYVAFRYEFSFAVGAVVAVLHDMLMTLGWFFLTGRELSAPMVAAMLTIIGFSINDTIVIFDRIREDLKLGVRGSFRDLINHALNQTLSRTIITSGTTFLATLALYLFGGPVLNDFAFTFLVGIVTGTYSTIFIAATIVLWWHKGRRPEIGQAPAGVVTARPEPARA